ncbi:hypothetical protein RZN25_11380 [Bacillaceae bacterium S4-13-56]
MSEKVKKPFYKKWWVWVIVVLIIIGAASGGGEETDNATNNENENASTNEESNNETNGVADAEEPAEDSEKIESGTYKVGTDLPAGEYLVFSDGMAYVESASDSTGSLDSIIFNLNLMGEAHAYVTVKDGQYFKLQGGHMYPVGSAPSVIPEDGLYEDGMYKVGQDIPAGEYKVLLDPNSSLGMGYLEVSSDSSHQLGSIVTNENVQADTYITVSEGQYLTLQDLSIQK